MDLQSKSEDENGTMQDRNKKGNKRVVVPPMPTYDQPDGLSRRRLADKKIVRMSGAAGEKEGEDDFDDDQSEKNIQEMEYYARSKASRNKFRLFLQDGYSAFRIFETYLITLDSLLGVFLVVAATLYVYYNDHTKQSPGLNWVLLGFAVVNPLSTTLGMSFFRRERSVRFVTNFRSYALQIYLAHALFGWKDMAKKTGGDEDEVEQDEDWIRHSDEVLTQLIGMGDDLCRFLTLPTSTLGYHHTTRKGRREAARIVEISYNLFDLVLVKRLTKLNMLVEKIARKKRLSDGETVRLRQVERQLGCSVESMRMIKMYRTPLALRVFAKLFTVFLPSFYCNNYAYLAYSTNSLGLALAFAAITSLALTSLFEAIKIMEDPFVAYTTLDGIDCREEFSVLHWHQLVNARKMIFPDAPPIPKHRVDEDGYVPNTKAVEGSIDNESLLLGKSKAQTLQIRESAYAALPTDEDEGVLLGTLRQRFNTGSSRGAVLGSRERASTMDSAASQRNAREDSVKIFGQRNRANTGSSRDVRERADTGTNLMVIRGIGKMLGNRNRANTKESKATNGRRRANTKDSFVTAKEEVSLRIIDYSKKPEKEDDDSIVHIFGNRSRFFSADSKSRSRTGTLEFSTRTPTDFAQGSTDKVVSSRSSETFETPIHTMPAMTAVGDEESIESVNISGDRARFFPADGGSNGKDGKTEKSIKKDEEAESIDHSQEEKTETRKRAETFDSHLSSISGSVF